MYAANPRAIDATTQFGVARVDNTQPAEVVALRSQLWYLAKKDLEAVQREEVSEPCSTQILKIGATERGGGARMEACAVAGRGARLGLPCKKGR